MTASTNTATLQLAPYVFFYGRCEEALEFYKQAFGGTFEISRNGDSPMADQVPKEWHNKVMHAHFTGPGFTFMASDGREGKTIDPDEGNITLSISANTAAEGERIFNALAAGGTVTQPYGDAFWGGKFGMVVDRFGIEWMLTGS